MIGPQSLTPPANLVGVVQIQDPCVAAMSVESKTCWSFHPPGSTEQFADGPIDLQSEG